MQKLYTALLLLLLVVFSCSPDINTDKRPPSITINLENAKEVNMFESCSEIELIPLETNKESVIGKMWKSFFYEDKIYVLDRNEFEVLVFDKKGKFLHKITNIGKGPGEYILIYDIGVNPFSGKLELLSPKGKLISYDLNTGQFNTDIVLSSVSSVYYFANVSADIVVFYSDNEDHQLIYYSRSRGEIIARELENIDLDRKVRMSTYSPFYTYNNSVQFLDLLTNKMYTLTDQGLIFRFRFDFGKKNMRVAELPDGIGETVMGFKDFLVENQLAFPIHSYLEDDFRIWCTVSVGYTEAKGILYNKDSKSEILFPFPIEHSFIPHVFSKGMDMYGCIVKAENVKKVFAGNAQFINPSILTNLSVNSNPVLVRYRFKENLFSK